MKNTKPSDIRRNKLRLKRSIVRQLNNQDLGRAHGGTWCEQQERPTERPECYNPIYSA